MDIIIEIKQLTKQFNTKERKVLDAVSLSINQGAIVSILGESGSGKTTLARIIAGFETPDSGKVTIAGDAVCSPSHFVSPQKRQIGMVFQDYALFPHMTVKQNIAYGVIDKAEKEATVHRALTIVGLDQMGHRYPHQLSGGQQQRVALARVLASQPKVLILDEPFSNLDTSLRHDIREDLFKIIKENQLTTLFLTHDTEDALAMSKTIVVLKDGKIQQSGTPQELYENPANLYVAKLFGPVTILSKEDLELFGYKPNTAQYYVIRPHSLIINGKNTEYSASLDIIHTSYVGKDYLITGVLETGKKVQCRTIQHIQGKVMIGFEKETLLKFE